MNKKILGISAAVVVVILLAGFTTFWFLGSSKLKRDLTEEIAKINENHKGGGSITYESVSSGGFPFSLTVTLNNVKVNVQNDKGAFNLEMDQLVFSKSLFGSSEQIGGMKDITISIPVHKGVSARKLLVNSADGLWFEISHFENGSGLGYVFGQKQLPTTDEEWKQFAKNIRGVNYASGKTTLTDASSGKVLWEGGSGEVRVAIEKQADERRKYNVKIAAKDLEMKAEFADWIKDLAKETKDLPASVMNFFSPSSGKTSYEAEFSVTAPQTGLGAIDVELARLDFRVGQTTCNLKGQINIDIPRKSGSLKFTGDYKADEAYRKVARKNLENYAKLIIEMAPKAGTVSDKRGVALTSAFIRAAGDLVDQPEGKFDLDISVPGLGATIKQAEYKAGPYGISINGDVSMLNPSAFKVHARINNGRALASKFAQEYEKSAQELGLQTAPEVEKRLNELFDMVVATPDPKDLIFSYSPADGGNLGTLTVQEATAQLTQIFEAKAAGSLAPEADDEDENDQK